MRTVSVPECSANGSALQGQQIGCTQLLKTNVTCDCTQTHLVLYSYHLPVGLGSSPASVHAPPTRSLTQSHAPGHLCEVE